MRIRFMLKKALILGISLGWVACASAPTASGPKKNLPPREAFLAHWKQKGSQVQVVQVLPVENGIYRGDAIIDGDPIEEFYNPMTGEISQTAPANGYPDGIQEKKSDEEKKALFKDLMVQLANELSQDIPANSRIAVLNIPSDRGKETKFSTNLASKLEMGFIRAGRDVVDRSKVERVMDELQFQQKESALFSPTDSARLGKFVGANTVVTGEYHASLPRTIHVTVKAISVETTRVISVQEKEIPLSGAGADNRDEVMELLQSK